MYTEDYKKYTDDIVNWIENAAPEWNYYINFINGIGNTFGKHKTENLKQFISWEQEMKKRRNKDFLEIFPELKPWYKYCHDA